MTEVDTYAVGLVQQAHRAGELTTDEAKFIIHYLSAQEEKKIISFKKQPFMSWDEYEDRINSMEDLVWRQRSRSTFIN